MSDIYQVGHLERVPLGTPYPGIVAHVGRLLGKLPDPELVIDYTGCLLYTSPSPRDS